MSTQQIGKCDCNVPALFENMKTELQGFTKEIIDREIGLFEMNLVISCMDGNKLEKANKDTEDFKKEMWQKAKNFSKSSGKSTLVEYKKSLNFI